jgi:dTMP kinase
MTETKTAHMDYEDQQRLAARPGGARFLAFEGPDGSGKSTLSRAVAETLHKQGVTTDRIYTCNFPSSMSAPGQMIRRVFSKHEHVSARGMAYLLVADRVERDPDLQAAYDRGCYIIADRLVEVSGLVYQAEEYPVEAIYAFQQRVQFLRPDRVYIIDIPPEVMEERFAKRAETRNELYEKKDRAYQQRLRARYLAYAYQHFDNTVLLDGTLPTDKLLDQVLTDVLRG